MTIKSLTLGQLAVCFSLTVAMDATAAPPGDPGPTPTPTPVNPWTSAAVPDQNLDYGSDASVAKTSTWCTGGGFMYPCTLIGVAHKNQTNSDLVYSYSTNGGQTWTHTTVDSGPNGDIVGRYASLAFLGSTPVISYQNETDNDLWVARRVGAGNGNCGANDAWHCKNLGDGGISSSIATDDNGRIVIAHTRGVGGVHIKTLLPPYSDFTTQTVVNASVRSVRVAIDNIHQIHVAWASTTCAYYSYGFFEEIETVECSPASPVHDAGRVSLVVNSSQRPHMAYTLNSNTGSYRLRHAYKVSYDTWTLEGVASFSTAPQPGTSIILASNGIDTGAISWGSNAGSPKLMVAEPGSGLLAWSALIADTSGGAFSGLTRVGSRLAVVHYDDAGNGLRFTLHD